MFHTGTVSLALSRLVVTDGARWEHSEVITRHVTRMTGLSTDIQHTSTQVLAHGALEVSAGAICTRTFDQSCRYWTPKEKRGWDGEYEWKRSKVLNRIFATHWGKRNFREWRNTFRWYKLHHSRIFEISNKKKLTIRVWKSNWFLLRIFLTGTTWLSESRLGVTDGTHCRTFENYSTDDKTVSV